MSDHAVNGSCFCGEVKFELSGNLGIFQYCHCSRCQKITGSAHASNLFVAPGQFSWLSGESNVGRYDPPDTKYFATAFCKNCGSFMPWLSKSGKVVIVPAGSLDDDPGIRPTQNIYCGSRPVWYEAANTLLEYEEGQPRKK